MGLVVAVVGSLIVWAGLAIARRGGHAEDPSRRRFLPLSRLMGLLVALGGAGLRRHLPRWARPDPQPLLPDMASRLGSPAVEYLPPGAGLVRPRTPSSATWRAGSAPRRWSTSAAAITPPTPESSSSSSRRSRARTTRRSRRIS